MPLHVVTLSELAALFSLFASIIYLLGFFGIGFVQSFVSPNSRAAHDPWNDDVVVRQNNSVNLTALPFSAGLLYPDSTTSEHRTPQVSGPAPAPASRPPIHRPRRTELQRATRASDGQSSLKSTQYIDIFFFLFSSRFPATSFLPGKFQLMAIVTVSMGMILRK